VQAVKSENICIMGIRSVDPAERNKISSAGITAHDMRKIDEIGVIKLLEEFLKKVNDANGLLHISLDVAHYTTVLIKSPRISYFEGFIFPKKDLSNVTGSRRSHGDAIVSS
jgi:hypothetical protein